MFSYFEKIWANHKEIELRDKILLASLLCYAVGFLITNIYLGSLGIVRLELLRLKYISASLLFATYYSSIAIPFGGFRRILFSSKKIDFKVTGSLLWHTFESFLVVWLAVSALALIGGSQQLFIAPTNHTITPQSLTEAMYPLALQLLKFVAPLGITCIVLFAIIFVIAFVILWAKKDLQKLWAWFANRENIIGLARGILIVCTMPILILVPFGVFGLTFSGMTPHIPFLSIPDGWERFIKTAFGFYALGAGILFVLLAQKEAISGDRHSEGDDWAKAIDPNMEETRSLVFRAMIFFFILGIYALHVYPVLPQQIGGGKEVPVILRSSNEEISKLIQSASGSFLIDKSDQSSIFKMVWGSQVQAYKILEISNDKIDFLEYKEPNIKTAKPQL